MQTRTIGLWLVLLASGCGAESPHATPEGAAVESTDDGGTSEGGGDACQPLEDLASQRAVTILVKNSASADRFVATQCNEWTPVTVDRMGATEEPLLLRAPFECGCECQPPLPAGVTALHRIAPGETFSFKWDARELVAAGCGVSQLCYGQWTYTPTQYVARPVAAGNYVVGVKVVDTVPTEYWSQNGNEYTSSGYTMAYPSSTPTQPLALPSSGDATVEINLD